MGWRYRVGLFFISAVVVIWVTSAEVTQVCFQSYFFILLVEYKEFELFEFEYVKSHNRKRKNRGVLQFFEDTADVDYDDDDEGVGNESVDSSGFVDNDFMEELFDAQPKVKNEMGQAHNLPFIPKVEQMDGEEFDKMMEECYKSNKLIRYAEEDYEAKKILEREYHMPCPEDPTIWKVKCMAGREDPLVIVGSYFICVPCPEDPTIWKVKCMAGRERQSTFCLIQKFVDLQSLGSKMQIISAFAVDHIKGFIFIEADEQCDIKEACKGLSGIYYSRLAPVPKK